MMGMKKPVLVVMAAGMGSRYGGLKQMDAIGEHGEVIIDYSIFDAKRAGFEKVVIIIKHDIEDDFKELVGNRLSQQIEVVYAYQEVDNLPSGYSVPQGRTKPWGTSQAVLSAEHLIDGPFAVINADDYYGPVAFQKMFDYLSRVDNNTYDYAMVGYLLENTLTENGHVARGVCTASNDGYLTDVVERVRIEKDGQGARFTEDGGETWTHLPAGTLVSMNLWGFTTTFLEEAKLRFPKFLDKALTENPLKAEYFLPMVVGWLLEEKKVSVKVLTSPDKWYGVTYKEDKPVVVDAVRRMTQSGLYPQNLWGE